MFFSVSSSPPAHQQMKTSTCLPPFHPLFALSFFRSLSLSLSFFLSFSLSTKKSQQVNEIDEIVKSIQKTPGFNAYLILNNDGVVLRWEQVKSSNVISGSSTTGSTGSGTTSSSGGGNNNNNGSSADGGGTSTSTNTNTSTAGSAGNEDEQQQSQQLYEQPPLTYEKAVQYSHHILDLCSKSKDNMKELFKSNGSGSSGNSGSNNGHSTATESDHHTGNHNNATTSGNCSGSGDEGEEYEVESIRVRTDSHELIIAQEGNYILVVIYVGQKNGNGGGDFSQDAVLGEDTK